MTLSNNAVFFFVQKRADHIRKGRIGLRKEVGIMHKRRRAISASLLTIGNAEKRSGSGVQDIQEFQEQDRSMDELDGHLCS